MISSPIAAGAKLTDPPRVDEAALARGAEIEEYNVGDPAQAMGIALRNLLRDPHHYEASSRGRWTMRCAEAGPDEAAAALFAKYKRDRGLGLDHERALEHAMSNYLTLANMKRTMAGQAPLSEAEVEALSQRVAQMAINEGSGGPTNAASDRDMMSRTAKDAKRDSACVMVNIVDPKLKKAFAEITASIPDEDVYDPPEEEKYGREDRFHITCKYGIETSDPEDVRPLVEGFGPIEATIKGVSFFRKEGKEYDVLKFDVESDDLARLRKKIEAALPWTDEHPIYHPHATIAYLKRGKAEKYADDEDFLAMAQEKLGGTGITFEAVCFSDPDGKKIDIKCAKSAGWLTHLAKRKHSPAYEKETAKIKENKLKPEARKPHDFKPAKWTHPNGHPRCIICGDEERTGGRCNVAPSLSDRIESGSMPKLSSLFESGAITYTDFRRRVSMTDETERLLGAYYAGEITQTDLHDGLRRIRRAK